jgi:hypothetical protein
MNPLDFEPEFPFDIPINYPEEISDIPPDIDPEPIPYPDDGNKIIPEDEDDEDEDDEDEEEEDD